MDNIVWITPKRKFDDLTAGERTLVAVRLARHRERVYRHPQFNEWSDAKQGRWARQANNMVYYIAGASLAVRRRTKTEA